MPKPKSFDPARIVEQALLLFWERGYEATSIDDLTAHLGINRSSLYHSFGDKHALFMHALTAYRIRIISGVEQVIADSESTRVAFQRLCDQVIGAPLAQRRLGCLMVNSITELLPGDDAVADLASAYTADLLRLIRQSLERDQARGLLPDNRPLEALALHLYTTFQGLRVLSKTALEPQQLTAVVQMALCALG